MFWENMKWVWHVYPEKNLRNGSLNAPKLISPWFRKKGGKEGGKERGGERGGGRERNPHTT